MIGFAVVSRRDKVFVDYYEEIQKYFQTRSPLPAGRQVTSGYE